MKPNIVFDMGQVLMDFAPPKFIARLGYTGDDAQALLPKDLVTELYGKGYDMYVLSNASQDFHRYFDRIPGSEYLPRARRFVSSDYRLLKPQHEIYELFLEKFGLEAADCVFIDDSPPNVEAARRLGFQALVHRGDPARLRRELKELGVDVEV